MLNVVVDGIIFEIQVVLTSMLTARAALDAHKAYNQFRSFSEVLELVGGDGVELTARRVSSQHAPSWDPLVRESGFAAYLRSNSVAHRRNSLARELTEDQTERAELREEVRRQGAEIRRLVATAKKDGCERLRLKEQLELAQSQLRAYNRGRPPSLPFVDELGVSSFVNPTAELTPLAFFPTGNVVSAGTPQSDGGIDAFDGGLSSGHFSFPTEFGTSEPTQPSPVGPSLAADTLAVCQPELAMIVRTRSGAPSPPAVGVSHNTWSSVRHKVRTVRKWTHLSDL
jgi:hypothetical protein